MPIDCLRETVKVVLDVLGLVGNGWCHGEHTEQQYTGHNQKHFRECHVLHPCFRLSQEIAGRVRCTHQKFSLACFLSHSEF